MLAFALLADGFAFRDADPDRAREALRRGLVIAHDSGNRDIETHLAKIGKGRTTAIVNAHVAPTADFASHPDLDLSPDAMQEVIASGAGAQACRFLPATELATALFGDAIAANLFLLGYALQRGCLPVGLPALEHAIELNGRANRRPGAPPGDVAAHDYAAVERAVAGCAGAERARHLARDDRRAASRPQRLSERRLARRYAERVAQASARGASVAGESGLAGGRSLLSSCSRTRRRRGRAFDGRRSRAARTRNAWDRVELHLARRS
jgi:indolepyruvate ferredoxin oxidoreductase